MGVPKFFRYISERYPCLSELVRMHQVPDFDNLYLDMNGIVHNCTHPDDSKVNQKITEEMMFLAIFRYIEYLFQVIKPRKLFFLAIDGVAPRAKMNQQRSRRFRSAKEMETLENAARQKGEVIEEEFRFDSNCITPGTEFMVRLHKALQFFIQRQISTNEAWQHCQVILSGHDTPGEGEHKIMDYIRYMKSLPDYDPNTTHCLYGLDADLIMLGCVTHEAHISLLREEVKFGKQNTKSNCVENTRFFLLHLGILKEYLELEFSAVRDQVTFGYDMEKIVDDWILMSFLVGNDFVPHLPNLHIQNNALPTLYNAYMDVLPSMGGYMNEDGILNLPRFQMFMRRLELEDRRLFKELHGETRYATDDMGCFDDIRNDCDPDDELAAFVKASEQMMMDDVLDGEQSEEQLFEKEFQMCRRDYYITKMHFPQDAAEHRVALRTEVAGYISAIQWILHYYYRGVPSWSWYFPSHYAPYISDITDFEDLGPRFELGRPFLPFQQLLGVLPPNSKDLLPLAYQDLMLNPNSPLIDFYPANFETDMNGKKQDWEALVLIPFIDETRLLGAMAECERRLEDGERQRNRHGPMSVYSFSEASTGALDGVLKLPGLPNSYCACLSVPLSSIHVAANRLVFGPPPGALTDVHFPGFPTMKFLNYSGKLANLRVRVFEMASNNETMELTVRPPPTQEHAMGVHDLHAALFDCEIFVGWPHLSHAKVVGVSDEKTYLGLNASVLAEHEVKKFSAYAKDINDHHIKRMGINLGAIRLLVHVHLVKAREYVLAHNGKLVLRTDWDNVKFVYPHQTIVPNLRVYNEHCALYKSVDEVYSRDTKVFLLSTKYYGCMGRVLDTSMLAETKRIQITIDVHAEPNLKDVLRCHNEAKLAARNSYFNMYAACSQIGISKHALNRVTGNFFVFSGQRRQVNERAADKVNVGLQMRLPKDNKEVPGISKYMDNAWYLSSDAIDIICQYLDAFPAMCDALAKPDNNIFEDDFCDVSELTPGSFLREMAKFAETLPHTSIRPRKMGTEYIDPSVAAAVERAADKVREEVAFKTIKLQTKLHLLFLPQTTVRCPDPGTTFRLFDRVIVATRNLSVPIGSKGTIVSIFFETDENPLKYENKNVTTYLYEVMFDDEVPGGDSYFGDIGRSRVQTVGEQSILNITYGRNQAGNRTEQEAPKAPGVDRPAVDRKQAPLQPAQAKGAASTAVKADKTHAQEMLDTIWNSLKGPLSASDANAFPMPKREGDLAEALKKCLKIAPPSTVGDQSQPSVIQQPPPAQLPPPPANWRIEAQIQHLSQARPTGTVAPPHAQPLVHSLGGPPPPLFQMPPVFMGGSHNQRFQPPHAEMGFPPPGLYPAGGPIGMTGFRPVAAMPFTNAYGPTPQRHSSFQQNPRNSHHQHQRHQQVPQGPQREASRLSGPHALRNAGSVSANGQGAFIPLQAARKIAKLKNLNGHQPNVAPSVVQRPVVVEESSGSAPKVSSCKIKDPKQVPVTRSKPNATPRPARLAANFSVKE